MRGSAVPLTPKQDNGRLAHLSQREQGSEVGIGGDENAILFQGAGKNILIGGIAQPIVANVDGIMPRSRSRSARIGDSALSIRNLTER